MEFSGRMGKWGERNVRNMIFKYIVQQLLEDVTEYISTVPSQPTTIF